MASSTTALITRPPSRTFIANASAVTNVNGPALSRGRCRKSSTTWSRSAAIRETCDFDNESIPRLLTSLSILHVDTPAIVGGLTTTATSWLTFSWVLGLGLVATQSLGAVLGALIRSSRGAGVLSVPVVGLIAISGILYPITALAGWLQMIAEAFPVYWLGLGMRSALLPTQAATLEIGQSWRPLETAIALGTWAVAGVAVAPIVLKHMARLESGSRVAQRRAQLLQRIG